MYADIDMHRKANNRYWIC